MGAIQEAFSVAYKVQLCILYMMPTPTYSKPLFTLNPAPPLPKYHSLLYTLPYEQGTTAKLESIFLPIGNTPKRRSTCASQTANHGFCCKHDSLSCRVLTVSGSSRSTLRWKYLRMRSSCLHPRPIQVTTNHTVWAIHNTMDQSHRCARLPEKSMQSWG